MFYLYLTALIAQLLKKMCTFSSYEEMNFPWTFHFKVSLAWKDQILALYLRPTYADQK